MPNTRKRGQRVGTRTGRALVLLLGALVLSSACGGQDAATTAPKQSGTSAAPAASSSTATGEVQRVAEAVATAARTVASAQATAAAQAQASGSDPCRVVTKEELEAALGFTLRPGERVPGPVGDDQCVYRAQANAGPGTMPDVTVALYRSRLARTTYEGLRESASSRTADVPGLGDKAYIFIGGNQPDTREMRVLKGEVLFSVDLSAIITPPVSLSEEEKRTKLIAVARTALGRF